MSSGFIEEVPGFQSANELLAGPGHHLLARLSAATFSCTCKTVEYLGVRLALLESRGASPLEHIEVEVD